MDVETTERVARRRSPLAVARALAAACHPGPALAVTVIATLLAVSAHAPGRTVALVAVTILTGQLSVGWCNDWLDAARDTAVGRRDKPVATGLITPATVRTAALVALVACVPVSFTLGWRSAVVHLTAVASAWSYDLWLKHTAWSAVPYAVSFGLLPLIVSLALPGHPFPAGWIVAVGALLGIGAHVANVLPDLRDDEVTGVRGFPHRLGRRWASVTACVALVTATVLLVLAPAGAPSVIRWVGLAAAVVLAAVGAVVGATRDRSRLPFLAAIAVALVDVLLLLTADWLAA
jgi:4-hydroxybenzoate polyprenyltransferase